MKRFVFTLMTVLLVVHAVSGTGRRESTIPTITLYPQAANISSGVVGGWKGDYFASRGFILDVWAYSDERTNTILASGDLPDVMYVNQNILDDMILGRMLVNLDGHLNKMPHAMSYQPLGTALNFVRQARSTGTRGLYILPLTVGDNATKYAVADSTERRAVKVRWDVYQQIGAPKPRNFDDLLDIMEQMLRASPRDRDGNPFYGTILNNGTDTTYWGCISLWNNWQGYVDNHLPYLLETNMVKGEVSSILSTNSVYYQGLKWYNQAYRRGLMDPDSINNDRATQKVKVDAGYALIPSGGLPGWAPVFYEIYVPNTNIYYSYSSMYGNVGIGISAKSRNLDASIAFLDMLCDADAMLTITNGPDGDYWYSDGRGNAFFTEAGTRHNQNAALADSTGYILKNGERLELWNTPWVINTAAETSFRDGQGNFRTPRVQQWREFNELNSQSDSFRQWQRTTGYASWKDWLNQYNAFYPASPLDGVNEFCSIPDNNMQLIVSAIKDAVVTASWQMVYASSDTEFQNIWNRMVSDCQGLGAQRVIDWRLADIRSARATKDSLIAR